MRLFPGLLWAFLDLVPVPCCQGADFQLMQRSHQASTTNGSSPDTGRQGHEYLCLTLAGAAPGQGIGLDSLLEPNLEGTTVHLLEEFSDVSDSRHGIPLDGAIIPRTTGRERQRPDPVRLAKL